LLRSAEAAAEGPVALFASDIEPELSHAFARYASGRDDVTFVQADVLKEDPFPDQRFDYVLIDPPLGAAPIANSGPQRGEMAWVRYACDHLASGGIGVVVTRHKILTDPQLLRERQALLRDHLVSAVITVPAIGHSSSLPLAVWLLENDPSRQAVVFIDAMEINARKWRPSAGTDLVLDALTQVQNGGVGNYYLGPTGEVDGTQVSVSTVRAANANLLPSGWTERASLPDPDEAASQTEKVRQDVARHLTAAANAYDDSAQEVDFGSKPEMVNWSTLENTALFVRKGERHEQDEDVPGLIRSLADRLDDSSALGDPRATAAGEVLFSPSGQLGQMAAIDDHGGHFLAQPVFGIQVDHPEGRITAEILCAWLNSSEVYAQAWVTPGRTFDVRSLEVPLFTPDQARELTRHLQTARKTSEELTHAAEAARRLPHELMYSARVGVTPQPNPSCS